MANVVISGDTSGAITLAAPAIAGTNTLSLPAQTATIATLTTPSFATTIGVGGATAAASGAGITFPASQSTSSDANTLDDYEEGTFTPTLFGASSAGATTYTTQLGVYTKIGRQVTVSLNVTATAATGTGELRIGGLPFAASGTYLYLTAPYVSGLNWGGGTYQMILARQNETNLEMQYMSDDGIAGNQAIANEAQGILLTLTYFI